MRLIAVVLFVCSSASSADPLVIAHRGASAYLPEHTLEAYAYAHAQGAQYIEPDLVLTKDKHLICLHDVTLERTTNVEDRYRARRRTDGRWYAADFTLAEIKRLSIHERSNDGYQVNEASHFRVPTFVEMIELIQGLNRSTGRGAGIYPELKKPSFHDEEGLPMEEIFHRILTKYDYRTKRSPIFVQCFEEAALRKLRAMGSLVPMILLIDDKDPKAVARLTANGLGEISRFANGIGPAKIIIEQKPVVVEWAHTRGIVVHTFTMEHDHYPADRYATFADELRTFFFRYKVDGVFTDSPDVALKILSAGS